MQEVHVNKANPCTSFLFIINHALGRTQVQYRQERFEGNG